MRDTNVRVLSKPLDVRDDFARLENRVVKATPTARGLNTQCLSFLKGKMMNQSEKLINFVHRKSVIGAVICAAACLEPLGQRTLLAAEQAADPVVLSNFTTSILGNSGYVSHPHGPTTDKRYVPNFFNDMAVAPDGTVFTVSAWDEGKKELSVYKDGYIYPQVGPGTAGLWLYAVAATDTAVYYTANNENVKSLWKFTRIPGEAVLSNTIDWVVPYLTPPSTSTAADGAVVAALPTFGEHGKSNATGIAVDESRGLVYVSDPASQQVKIHRISDGKAMGAFNVRSPGKLTVDGDGNVWVIQEQAASDVVKINGGTPIGSDNKAPESGLTFTPDRAFDMADESMFVAAGAGGHLGVDYGSPKRVSRIWIKYFGSPDPNTTVFGGRMESSNDNVTWTLQKLITEPVRGDSAWVQTIDDPAAYRYWRISAANDKILAVRDIAFYETTPNVDGAVHKFGPNGQATGISITDIVRPMGIAYDAVNKRLLVGDSGPTQQVVGYKNLAAGTPVLDTSFATSGRFGANGGIWSTDGGKSAGAIGAERFFLLNGSLGVDATGRLFVANYGGVGTARLESYSSTGNMLWQLFGGAFIDQGQADPISETDFYTGRYHYKMDYSKLASNEWTAAGMTMNPIKYPDDFRWGTQSPAINQGAGVRRINGELFLILATQYQAPYAVMRISGKTAIPAALFDWSPNGKVWPANQPISLARWLWRDTNGNGAIDKDEYESYPNTLDNGEMGIYGADFDTKGNFWYIRNNKTIECLTVADQLDAHGNPVWSWINPTNRSFPIPKEFDGGEVRQIRHDNANNTMYLFGYTSAYPNSLNQTFPHPGRYVAKYAVNDGTLTFQGGTDVPYNTRYMVGEGRDRDHPRSATIAGEYVFVGYMMSQATVVFRKSDLGMVGVIKIGQQSFAPWLDGADELQVTKRPDVNEYLITLPEMMSNKTTMIRWTPDVTAAPLPPTSLVATAASQTQVNLTWTDNATNETAYRVERMEAGLAGFGQWKEITTALPADTKSYSDTTLKAGIRYAYRVRAFNAGTGGGPSDYSWTIHVLTPTENVAVPNSP